MYTNIYLNLDIAKLFPKIKQTNICEAVNASFLLEMYYSKSFFKPRSLMLCVVVDLHGSDASRVWQVSWLVPAGAHLFHHRPDTAVWKGPEGSSQKQRRKQRLRRHLLSAAEQRHVSHVLHLSYLTYTNQIACFLFQPKLSLK